MSATRLDFKRLRAEAKFATVFAAYEIALTKDGTQPGQFKALCPFHDDTKPSLKVNTERNIFHCFACDAKGNILDFVKEMDGVDIREAAKKVANLCGLAGGTAARRKSRQKPRQPNPEPPSPSEVPETPMPEDLGEPPKPNPPLTFTLKLEQSTELETWLAGRGIDAATSERFGLGLASAKSRSIAGRLAIPIHDREGQLIAYCGRYVGDELPDDTPKYVLPKGFRKDIEVFNLHRYLAQPPRTPFAVLFESYFSVMRHAAHVPALSAMGRSLSEAQIALLHDAGITRILVVSDGDNPGRTGARLMAGQLAPICWTRVVDLPDGTKPHRLSWHELRPYLLTAWQEIKLPS